MNFQNKNSFLYDFTNNFDPALSPAIEPVFKETVEKLEEDMDFFMDNTKKFGRNSQGEKCLKGFCVQYYNRGGVMYEPIIFNLDTGQYVVDFKKLGIGREEVENYYNFTKGEFNYKRLINLCFIFGDKNGVHEFIFDANHLYDKKNTPIFLQILNTLEFKNNLEKQLDEKSLKSSFKKI